VHDLVGRFEVRADATLLRFYAANLLSLVMKLAQGRCTNLLCLRRSLQTPLLCRRNFLLVPFNLFLKLFGRARLDSFWLWRLFLPSCLVLPSVHSGDLADPGSARAAKCATTAVLPFF